MGALRSGTPPNLQQNNYDSNNMKKLFLILFSLLCIGAHAEEETLPLDDVYGYYYSHSNFSSEGRYCYFYNFGSVEADQENGFPWLMFKTYQATHDGIVAGIYSLADGTLGSIVLLRSITEFNGYKEGLPITEFTEATVTMTNKGGNNWNMTFRGVSTEGEVFVADTTLPISVSETKDANDPTVPNSGGGGPQPGEEIKLEVNYGEVELWTDSQFCPIAGHYDYFFRFIDRNDKRQIPYVEFDVYLPVKGMLQEGTYKLGDKLQNFNIILNNEDEQAWENNTSNYDFVVGDVKLTQNNAVNWTVEVTMITRDGHVYTMTHTQDFTIRWRDDDPTQHPGLNDTFNHEPTTPEDIDINFHSLEVSEEYIQDYGFYYLNLESNDINAEGENMVTEIYFRPKELPIPAGTYPISFDDETESTFVASHGDGMSGGRYPSYIALYNGHGLSKTWYLDHGNITIAYDTNGQMLVTGDVWSHYGSHIRFTNDPTNYDFSGIAHVAIDGAGVKLGKFIERGQVRVRHNGHTYSLDGVQ